MDWRNEAAEKLTKYEYMRQSLGNIPEEIKRLEGDYAVMRTSAVDSTPAHGSGSRREDYMLSNIVRREELAWQLESAKAWVALVDNGLNALNDDDKLVLDRFYIHRRKGACEILCEELDREKAQVYRRRDRALRRFTIALYGGLES